MKKNQHPQAPLVHPSHLISPAHNWCFIIIPIVGYHNSLSLSLAQETVHAALLLYIHIFKCAALSRIFVRLHKDTISARKIQTCINGRQPIITSSSVSTTLQSENPQEAANKGLTCQSARVSAVPSILEFKCFELTLNPPFN